MDRFSLSHYIIERK